MGLEYSSPPESSFSRERDQYNRIRLVAHLGRVFMRNYNVAVLPSNIWATGLDKKTEKEVEKYVKGERETLDDLPAEDFEVKKLLYDRNDVFKMDMDQIIGILRHEAGHAKYTDFRTMIEGQKIAKDQGHLPTSFWLMFEGLEDPRVNNLEGEASPAIDRQIRNSNSTMMEERLKKRPITTEPKMFQFMLNGVYYWLNGRQIPGVDKEVEKATESVLPLIDQYFQNTDLEQRKLLQKQIWEGVKGLEQIDMDDDKKRQMAQYMQMKGQKGQGQGQGQGQQQQGSGEGQSQAGEQGSGSNESGKQGSSSGSSQEGEDVGINYPGGSGSQSGGGQEQAREQAGGSEEGKNGEQERGSEKPKNQYQRRSFLNRLKKAIFGGEGGEDNGEKEVPRPEKLDLSQYTDEQLKQIDQAIKNLSPQGRQSLEKFVRAQLDELQKQILERELSKALGLKKNKETGEYEVKPEVADEKEEQKGQQELDSAIKEVEREEQAQYQQEESQRKIEEIQNQLFAAQKREKIEMQRAGFDENEREKYLLYEALERSMYGYVRNFRNAMEKIVPRKKQGVYEGGYFSGPKFDRRDLIRKAPLKNEQFHMRMTEKPLGDPRLFIGLLVDNSGSMGGEKQEEARKTMIFFARVCKEMGIPFMAASFGEGARLIKSFKQDFDNPAERIKPAIIDNTDANDGSTNLHTGLEMTIDAMNEMRRRITDSHGIIFVITDGGANVGLTGSDLTQYIEDNRGRLTFKGFGLAGRGERGDVKQMLNGYFGESNCAYPKTFAELPDEAFRVLRTNLMQFQRFLK